MQSSGTKKRTTSSKNSQKRVGNDQQNFLVEPKQEILKMCHFPRIEKKSMELILKVLILISGNQFSYGVTSS